MDTKKINAKMISLYFFGFLLLNMPNLKYCIGLNNYIVVGMVMSLFMLKYVVSDKKFFGFLKKKYVVYYIIFLLISVAYYAIRTLFAGTGLTDFQNMRLLQNSMPIFYLLGALILNYELNKLNYSTKDKFKFIIKVALIQSLLCIMMYIIPSFKKVAENIFYSANNKKYNIYISRNRLYGICDGDYTYGFQILYAMISTLSICFAYFYKESKYYAVAILFLLVTFSNGRSGIMIFLSNMIVFLIVLVVRKGQIVKAVKILLISSLIGFCIYNFIYRYMPNAAALITHAVTDITSFSDGKSDTETGRLAEMFIFPKGIKLVFGEGYRVLGKKGSAYGQTQSSDIGIVNDLYMGGLVYVAILYGIHLYLYKVAKKKSDKKSMENVFLPLCLISVAFANIKGEFFRDTLLQQFIFIVIVFTLFSKEENSKDERGLNISGSANI